MKRFFFLTVAATALFAACNKTEVVPTGEVQEISFVAVNKVATKVPVDGDEFKDGDDMHVAAYIVAGSEDDGNFFGSTHFTKKDGADYWTGDPARYWPLTSSRINFLAVTGTGGGASNSTTTFTGPYASGATVILNDNSAFNQNDLMFAAGQGTHVQGGGYNPVAMTFKHALSWVKFIVCKKDQTGYDIVVNSIKLNGASYQGTLTLSNGQYNEETTPTTGKVEASWSNTTPKDGVLVPNKAGTGPAEKLPLAYSDNLGFGNLYTDEFGNGLLVVPGYATSFTINYTLTQAGGVANTFDYTYTLPDGGKWEMAKAYLYYISFDLSEIEIEPDVNDWEISEMPEVSLN